MIPDPKTSLLTVLIAHFDKLSGLLEKSVLEKAQINEVKADPMVVATYRHINKMAVNNLKEVLSRYCKLLNVYESNETYSFVILLMMNELINFSPPKKTKLSADLISALLNALIKCHTCWESRLLLSIYLNVEPKESFTVNQPKAAPSDKLIKNLMFYLSHCDPISYSTAVVTELVTLFQKNSLIDKDNNIYIDILDSKLKYGFLESIRSLASREGEIEARLRKGLDTLHLFSNSRPFQFAAYCQGAMTVLKFIKEKTFGYMSFNETSANIKEILEFVFSFTIDSKSPLSNNYHPLSISQNYVTLMVYICLCPSLIDKFLKHHSKGNNKGGNHLENSLSSNMNSLDIKMFLVLYKIIDVEDIHSTDDKTLVILCFSVLLQVSSCILPIQANHPVIEFTLTHINKIYQLVENVLFSPSSSVAENLLIEPFKIEFLSNLMNLLPELYYPKIDHFLQNSTEFGAYQYFIVISAINKILDDNNYSEKVRSLFSGLRFYNQCLNLGINCVDDMMSSLEAHREYLKTHPTQVTHSALYPIVDLIEAGSKKKIGKKPNNQHYNHNKSEFGYLTFTRPNSEGRLEYETSSSSVAENTNATFHSPRVLSRSIYEEIVDILSLSPSKFFTSEPLFIKDSELLKDDSIFEKSIDGLINGGASLFAKFCVGGILDCQSTTFDVISNLLLKIINDETIINDYKYCTLAIYLSFMIELMEQTIKPGYVFVPQSSSIYTFLTEFSKCYVNSILNKINKPKFFGNENSIRYKKYLLLTELYEENVYNIVCTVSPGLYDYQKLLIKRLNLELNIINEFIPELAQTVNLELMCQMASADTAVIKSEKYLFQRTKKFLEKHCHRNTKALQNMIDKAMLQIETLEELAINDIATYERVCMFVGLVMGISISEEPFESSKQLSDGSDQVKFICYLFTVLNGTDQNKKLLAEMLLCDCIHPNCLLAIYRLLENECQKFKEKSIMMVFSVEEYSLLLSYGVILDKSLKRCDKICLFKHYSRFASIGELLISTMNDQYFLILRESLLFKNVTSFMDSMKIYNRIKVVLIRFITGFIETTKNFNLVSTLPFWKNRIVQTFLSWLEICYFRDETIHFNNMVAKCSMKENFPENVINDYIRMATSTSKEIVLNITKSLIHLTLSLPMIRPNLGFNKEIASSRTIIFTNYFNTLKRVLIKSLKDIEAWKLPINNKKKLLLIYSESETENIVEEIIETMGNLLFENYDIGCYYFLESLPLQVPIYHSVLLKVFRKIYNKEGIREKFSLGPNQIFFKMMYHMITKVNFLTAIRNIIKKDEIDKFSMAMFSLLKTARRIPEAIEELFGYELEISNDPLNVLRKNNFTTKLLNLICTNFGKPFLESTVGVIIKKIEENQDFFDEDSNFEVCLKYLEKLVDLMIENIDKLDEVLKNACFVIKQLSMKKFENNEEIALRMVKGFIIAKFVCPTIAYPEHFELINNEVDENFRKSLICLTKTLQTSLKNSFNFDSSKLQEDYTKTLYFKIDDEFINKICLEKVSIEINDNLSTEEISKNITTDELCELYSFSVFKATEWRLELCNPKTKPNYSINQLADYLSVMQLKYSGLQYKYLRFYPQIAEFIKINQVKYSELYNQINSIMNDSEYENYIDSPFFKEDIAKDGTQVFILTYEFFKNFNERDIKYMVVRFLQSICRMFRSNYYIVIDFTAFSGSKNLTNFDKFSQQISNYLPDEINENCKGIFAVNISDKFVKFFYKLVEKYELNVHKFLNPKFHKISILSTFKDEKVIDSLNLTTWSCRINNSKGELFDEHFLWIIDDKPMESNLKITDRYVIYGIKNLRKIKINNMVKTFNCVNVEKLIDWQNLQEISSEKFKIYSNLFEKRLEFLNLDKKSQIIKLFNLGLSQFQYYEINEYRNTNTFSSFDSIEDLLGEAIIISGIGLASDDPLVRKNAYNTICSLRSFVDIESTSFTVDIGEGYSLPQNDRITAILFHTIAAKNPDLIKKLLPAFNFLISKYTVKKSLEKINILRVLMPWLDWVFEKIYLSGNENSIDLIRTFIQSILNIVDTNKFDLVVFNNNIWSKLIYQSSFLEIIFEEILKSVMNRILTGIEVDSLISLLILNPSLKLCGILIEELLKDLKISKTIKFDENNFDLYLIKIKFLLKVCGGIFYEQIELTKIYLSELIFVCLMFHKFSNDFEIKKLIKNLYFLIINNLKNDDKLSTDSQLKLKSLSKDLNNEYSNYLFGISKIIDKRENHQISEIHTINFSCSFLIKTSIRVISLPEFLIKINYSDIWISKILRYSFNYSFKDHLFEIKSLRILGQYSKFGIDDLFVSKYFLNLKNLLTNFKADDYYNRKVIILLMNLGYLFEGLQKNSKYLLIFSKIAGVLSLFDNILIFEVSVFIWSKISKFGGKLIEKNWRNGEKSFRSFEQFSSKYIDESTFKLVTNGDIYLMLMICKIMFSKYSSGFIKYATDISKMSFYNQNKPINLIPYYIKSINNEEFEKFMIELNVPIKEMIIINNENKVPKSLVEFLLSKEKNSFICLIIIGKIFNINSINLRSQKRILELIIYLGSKQSFIIEFIYPIIYKELFNLSTKELSIINLVEFIQIFYLSLNYNEKFDYKLFLKKNSLTLVNFNLIFKKNESFKNILNEVNLRNFLIELLDC